MEDAKQSFKELLTKHIYQVGENLHSIIVELSVRAIRHDYSKFGAEEAPFFIEYSPKLKQMEYGSDEYLQCLDNMRPALDHHYDENRHHPEHFSNGISDMNMLDLLEMLSDWYGATKLSRGGDLMKSIEYNQGRFHYSDELKNLLVRTAKDLNWIQ